MSDPAYRPYVGPAPFTHADAHRFFARRRETADLFAHLVSSRTVVLYAQSGTGKTSLVNAGLIPRLQAEGFDVLPAARVQGAVESREAFDAAPNAFAYCVLLSWGEHGAGRTSLADALASWPVALDADGEPATRVLVFDQFEELFNAFPDRAPDREGFFVQVAEALGRDPLLRVLFVIREDYLGEMLARATLLPDRMATRYRLVRLAREPALEAATGPLAATPRHFGPGVAEKLVEDLLKIRVETAPGSFTEVVGDFVEPVQLQVVCQSLYAALPPAETEITFADLRRFGDPNRVLSLFYRRVIRQTARQTGVREDHLRFWFRECLLTTAHTRAMVYRGHRSTDGLPNVAVDALEDRHLIRAEVRSGSRWYELTHDRFIDAIRSEGDERYRRPPFLYAAPVAAVLCLLTLPLLFGGNLARSTLLAIDFWGTVTCLLTAIVVQFLRYRFVQRLRLSRHRQSGFSRVGITMRLIVGGIAAATAAGLLTAAVDRLTHRPEAHEFWPTSSLGDDGAATFKAAGVDLDALENRLSADPGPDCGGTLAHVLVGDARVRAPDVTTELGRDLTPEQAHVVQKVVDANALSWCAGRTRHQRNGAVAELDIGLALAFLAGRSAVLMVRPFVRRRRARR